MLGKIVKHEFRSLYKAHFIVYIALLALSGMTFIVSRVWLDNPYWRLLQEMIVGAYIIFLFLVPTASIMLSAIRYYQSMVGREGYLTHTLPVEKMTLIFGKLVAALLWLFVSMLAILVSAVLLAAFSLEEWRPVLLQVKEFIEGIEFSIQLVGNIVLTIVAALLVVSFLLIRFYLASAVGQIFMRHKTIATVIAYFISYYITNFLSVLVMVVAFQIGSVGETINPYTYLMAIMAMLYGVCCIAGFAITNYLMSRKLNLE